MNRAESLIDKIVELLDPPKGDYLKCRSCGYIAQTNSGIVGEASGDFSGKSAGSTQAMSTSSSSSSMSGGSERISKPVKKDTATISSGAPKKPTGMTMSLATETMGGVCPECGDMMEVYVTSAQVMSGGLMKSQGGGLGGALSGGAYS